MDAAGDFVIAWDSYGQDGSSYGIFAQRYSAQAYVVTETGTPGNETLVFTKPAGSTANTSVTVDSKGMVTVQDPIGFVGGPFTGVSFLGSTLQFTPGTAGAVHMRFDLSANNSQQNKLDVSDSALVPMPGFDVISKAGSSDVLRIDSSLETSSTIAASAGISLSNVATVVVGSPVTIQTAVAATDAPGSVNFGGAVVSGSSANAALTVNATSPSGAATGGAITVNSATNAAGFVLSSLNLDSLGTSGDPNGVITLGPTISTSAGQTYNGPVQLAANATFSASTSGGISFGSTVDGPFSLTIAQSGTTAFNGSVGGQSPLSSLAVTASNPGFGVEIEGAQPASLIGVTTTGSQTYSGAFDFQGNLTLTSTASGNIAFQSTIDDVNLAPGSGLFVNTSGAESFLGAIGSNRPFDSFYVVGGGVATLAGGSVTTNLSQTYQVAVQLAANTSLTSISTSASSGNLLFSSTIDSDTLNTPRALTINSSGITQFNGSVGSLAPLASLSVTAALIDWIGKSSATTGGQTFSGPLTLNANAVFSSSVGGNLAFQAINSASGNSGNVLAPRDLNLSTSGQILLHGPVGATPLNSLTVGGGGTTVLSGGSIATDQTQSYQEAVQLAADTTLTSSVVGSIAASVCNILFSSTIDSDTVQTPRTLSLNAAGEIVFGGIVGGKAPINNLTTAAGGQTFFNIPTPANTYGVTTIGTQTYNDPVVLDANTLLESEGTAAGNLYFVSTVNAATAGMQGLSLLVHGYGSLAFGAGVGQTNPLATLSVVTAGPLMVGVPVTTVGSISLTSGLVADPVGPHDVTLSAPLTSTGGNITLTAGQNITVNATVTVSAGTLSIKPNLDGTGGTVALPLNVHATAINVVGNGTTSNGLILTGGAAAAQVVVQESNQSISGYGGPVVTYQNIQALGLDMAGSVANSLSIFTTAGSTRAIVDPLTSGSLGPGTAPSGPSPVAGSLQEFQIANIANLEIVGSADGDDLENHSGANALLEGGSGNDTLIGGHGVNVIFGGGGNDNIVAGDGSAIPLPVANPATFFGNYLYADYAYNNGNPLLIVPPGGASTGSMTGNTTPVGNPPVVVGNSLVVALYGEKLSNFGVTPPSPMSLTAALAAGVAVAKTIDPPGQGGPFYISNNNQLSVLGTTGDDSISVFFDPTQPTQFLVDVDGTSQSFSTSQITSIQIDGAGGTDTTALSLPAGSTATLMPGSAIVDRAGQCAVHAHGCQLELDLRQRQWRRQRNAGRERSKHRLVDLAVGFGHRWQLVELRGRICPGHQRQFRRGQRGLSLRRCDRNQHAGGQPHFGKHGGSGLSERGQHVSGDVFRVGQFRRYGHVHRPGRSRQHLCFNPRLRVHVRRRLRQYHSVLSVSDSHSRRAARHCVLVRRPDEAGYFRG